MSTAEVAIAVAACTHGPVPREDEGTLRKSPTLLLYACSIKRFGRADSSWDIDQVKTSWKMRLDKSAVLDPAGTL
ncbi:hypothetical protein AUH73_00210 [archaeon 13_1_40CM_4_53_4]|nr:MAG: hypothetical protein AUH73_00210 [archaeon 13_1_40CM_4_53_4]